MTLPTTTVDMRWWRPQAVCGGCGGGSSILDIARGVSFWIGMVCIFFFDEFLEKFQAKSVAFHKKSKEGSFDLYCNSNKVFFVR